MHANYITKKKVTYDDVKDVVKRHIKSGKQVNTITLHKSQTDLARKVEKAGKGRVSVKLNGGTLANEVWIDMEDAK